MCRTTGRAPLVGLRLAIGLLITVLVLRTWLLLGVAVPLVVSSGSMATALLGPHRDVTCRRCGTAFAIGADRPADGPSIPCPNCGAGRLRLDGARRPTGDRLLVDRSAWWWAPARRWEMVVLRDPERAYRLAVKRIVGLPGERVAIRGGDIHIDGQIARKTLAQQRRIVQLVHRVTASAPSAPRWRARTSGTSWQRRGGVYRYDGQTAGRRAERLDGAASPRAAVDWLDYHHPGRRGVTDAVPYNPGQARLLAPVTDLMLVCRLAARGRGAFDLQATRWTERFLVELRLGDDCVDLYRNGRKLFTRTCPLSGLSRPTRIEFSTIDAQIVLAIGGQVCLRYPFTPTTGRTGPASSLAIGGRGITARVESLEVWRDVYYVRPAEGGWGVDFPYRCGPDEYFLLGDNSPIARDSRQWPCGGLPGRLLVGRVLAPRRSR